MDLFRTMHLNEVLEEKLDMGGPKANKEKVKKKKEKFEAQVKAGVAQMVENGTLKYKPGRKYGSGVQEKVAEREVVEREVVEREVAGPIGALVQEAVRKSLAGENDAEKVKVKRQAKVKVRQREVCLRERRVNGRPESLVKLDKFIKERVRKLEDTVKETDETKKEAERGEETEESMETDEDSDEDSDSEREEGQVEVLEESASEVDYSDDSFDSDV